MILIVLVQRLHYDIDCAGAKIVLMQEMCWCKECADAKIAL